MAFTDLKWWRCPYCGAHLFITNIQTQVEMITSHFQTCSAIHQRLAETFERIANNKRKDNYEQNREGRRTGRQ
jgi:hypothetical protein